MVDAADEMQSLSPLQRALLTIKEMRARLEAVERAKTEPLAVIGIGCRFPGGANSPEAFWRLLQNGVDAIAEVPADRWDINTLYDNDFLVPGKINTRYAGFLEGADLFDAAFFGISPREATRMDPQQRLLLEMAYEALEDGGQSLERLAGSRTGVFIGAHSHSSDYTWLQMADLVDIDMHTSTGTAHSILANRLSFLFDWQGPSLVVDTACSSSLVAVHLACQSLRNRECNMALAGGVNLMLTPETTVTVTKMQALAPDGRCKTFDARADGFARGEGCGVIVLKRLSDALAADDPILALIAGSAVNQDGATNGLTAPNSLSQRAVIRQALANGGVQPEQISYVEAHGTGTVLGDPIEVEALTEVIGQPRPDGSICALGSVKTNIGHLEGAAGIAGLIKTILALQHEAIPPHLHFQQLNPHISLDNTPFVIPTTERPWPAGTQRHAGVSSFGFGGTNAHVIVTEAPLSKQRVEEERAKQSPGAALTADRACLLPLSARSQEALRALAHAYQDFLNGDGPSLADVACTASLHRSHHDYRLALAGNSRAELVEQLLAFMRDEVHPDVAHGHQRSPAQRGLVFVFSGQGTQLTGMGRELLQTEPIFRAKVEECDALLRPYASWSLLEELAADSASSRLDENEIFQPAIFTIQVALAALWRSWGIVPDAVVGHSVGEVAAAHVAGVLSLSDAVRVIFHRGRVIQKATGMGRMAAVALSPAEAEKLLADYKGQVSLAAVNSPTSTVLSGDAQAVAEVVQQLQAQGLFARLLAVNYASHSHVMEPFCQELAQSLAGITPQPARLPIYSTVTGAPGRPGDFDAAYWGRNLRQPVLLAAAVAALATDSYATFLEIGPHPLLTAPLAQCLAGSTDAVVLASLRRNQPELETLLRTLGALYTQGYPINWHALYPAGGQMVPLPSYPWQHRRYWFERAAGSKPQVASRRESSHSQSTLHDSSFTIRHPFLNRRLRSPLPMFEAELDPKALPLLNEHRFHELAVLPTTAFVEMVQVAAENGLGAGPYLLDDVAIQEALLLSEDQTRTVQLLLTPQEAGAAAFQVFSLDADSATWTLHATGHVRRAVAITAAPLALSEIQARCRSVDVAGHYRQLAQRGLHFGPSFQGIARLWRRDGEALAHIRLTEPAAAEASLYHVHPALLDACLQPLAATLAGDATYLLIGLERLLLNGPLPAVLWSHAQLRPPANGVAETVVGDVILYDETGRPLGHISGMLLKRTDEAAVRRLLRDAQAWSNWLYDVVWQPQPHRVEETAPLAADSLPSPRHLAAQLALQVEPLAGQHNMAAYQALRPQLDALSVAYVRLALRQLGWQPEPGQRFTRDALAQQLGVMPHYQRLLGQMLVMLAEEGIVRPAGDAWKVITVPEVEDVVGRPTELAKQHPACVAELDLLGRCGPALARVLRGEADPLHLLFPEGSFSATENLYRASPFTQMYNALVGEVVTAALAHLPSDRPIRILEIGAGTGGTTTYVLPHLPPERAQYVFTDVSPLFLERARDRFRDYSFVRYELLDIESDLAASALAPHHFDLILAANVVHATADLRRTLAHVQQLLAPQGLLLLLEVTQPQRWIDLTFGLTEGWWKFADTDLRPSHPLLSPAHWLELLADSGFSEAAILPHASSKSDLPQTVILGRAPGQTEALPEQPGQWLIFADGTGLGARLADLLRARREKAVLVTCSDTYAAVAGNQYQLDPTRPEHFDRLLREAIVLEQPFTGLLYLWGLDMPLNAEQTAVDLTAAQELATGGALLLTQALLRAENIGAPRLWLITRDAQPVGVYHQTHPPSIVQSPLWGLGRVIALEHPGVWGGLIDVDATSDTAEQAAHVFAELWWSDEAGEDQIAWRANQRYVARLTSHHSQLAVPDFSFTTDNATYLITGGLGGLGLRVARWLAERGVRHLVLTSRTGLPDRTQWQTLPADSEVARRVTAVQAIESLGATVTVAAVDVANEAQMAALFTQFGNALPPLKGILHAAAAVSFAPLAEMSQATLLEMFHAKIAGAWVLHRLTQSMDLDCFVLFSSTTALWGVHSLAHYAAANCFLDSLAHYRHALDLPALSVNWGLWEERRIFSGEEQAQVARFGLRAMPVDQALAALAHLLSAATTQKAVAAVDWNVLKPAYEARRRRPFLSQIEARPETVVEQPGAPARPLRQQLQDAPPAERSEKLLDFISAQVARVMGYGASYTLDPEQGLFSIGMDSLMAVELKNRLEAAVGQPLPAALIFNYPSTAALAGYLEREVLHLTQTAEHADLPVNDTNEEMGVSELESISEDDLLSLFDDELAAIDDLIGEG